MDRASNRSRMAWVVMGALLVGAWMTACQPGGTVPQDNTNGNTNGNANVNDNDDGNANVNGNDNEPDPIAQREAWFPTSFHGSRHGKANFYEAPDGFANLTGIPASNLPCAQCHAANYADGMAVDNATYQPGCRDCHADPASPGPVADTVCLGCHGRQGAEQNLFTDVHRAAGMGCSNCHTDREMHGDGTQYASLLAAGATDTRCETCHVDGDAPPADPAQLAHIIHLDSVSCSACHVESVSSCYNCHFESEVARTGKRFFNQAPRTGFKMLVNFEGKVRTATFQTLSHEGKTFVAIAPFVGHSVTRQGSACGDCHLQGGTGNQNLKEYVDSGKITVTRWDAQAEGAARLVGPTGIIPVPPDWQTALEFAFLQYTGADTDPINKDENLPLWDFLKTEQDGQHMPYGTPLTAEQMEKLADR